MKIVILDPKDRSTTLAERLNRHAWVAWSCLGVLYVLAMLSVVSWSLPCAGATLLATWFSMSTWATGRDRDCYIGRFRLAAHVLVSIHARSHSGRSHGTTTSTPWICALFEEWRNHDGWIRRHHRPQDNDDIGAN